MFLLFPTSTYSTHTKPHRTNSIKIVRSNHTDSPLVSTNLVQDAQHGASQLLECRSIPEHVPLDYCRFVSPDGMGFSINEQITVKR